MSPFSETASDTARAVVSIAYIFTDDPLLKL